MRRTDLRWFDRLVRYFGGARDRDPADAFQRRFLIGCDLAAIAISVISLPGALAGGQTVTGWVIAGFMVVVAALAFGLRAGLPLAVAVWGNLLTLAGFLFLASIATRALIPDQLAWLVLLPLCSTLSVRPGTSARSWAERAAVPIGCALAIGVAVVIVVAHEVGLTFDEPHDTGGVQTLINFVPLVLAVGYLATLLLRLLQAAEVENGELRSLLAVCAWCHKIRNDDGEWEPIGKYMHDRGTPVTHGMCEGCLDRLEHE